MQWRTDKVTNLMVAQRAGMRFEIELVHRQAYRAEPWVRIDAYDASGDEIASDWFYSIRQAKDAAETFVQPVRD